MAYYRGNDLNNVQLQSSYDTKPAAQNYAAQPSQQTSQPSSYGSLPSGYQYPQATQPQTGGGIGSYFGYDQGANYGMSGNAPAYTGWVPTQEFSDPTTANLENLLNYQAQYYMQPVYDPARAAYAQSLSNLAGGGGTPGLNDYMGTLNRLLQEASGPSPGEGMLMRLANELANGNIDPYMQEYRAKLQQDPYTGSEWEAYRTAALDPIEQDRKVQEAQALNRISQQGIDPSSGIAQALQNQVQMAAQQARAGAQNQLGIRRVEDRRQRDREIFDIANIAEQFKQAGKTNAIGAASGAGSLWGSRIGQQAGLAGQLNSAAESGAASAASGARGLYSLSQQMRNETDQRYGQALQLATMLAQLPAQRQAEAMSAMSMGTDPSQVMASLGNISGMNAQGQQIANQNSANLQAGLGSLLGYLGPMFNTTSGGAQSGGGGYVNPNPTLAPAGEVAGGYTGYMPGNVDWGQMWGANPPSFWE